MTTFTHFDENQKERCFVITPQGIYESGEKIKDGGYIYKGFGLDRLNEWEQLQKIRMVTGIYEINGWQCYTHLGLKTGEELRDYWENYHEHTTQSVSNVYFS